MTETLPAQNSPARLATAFVEARLAAHALAAYPGAPPGDLAAAYAIQDAAIDLWPDEIGGWKIGLVQPEQRAIFGETRIAGPIFKKQILRGDGIALPVIRGGFAAVEAEFVLRVDRAAPADKLSWTPEEAADYADTMHIGIEFAGSPLRAINDLGPAVTASDFGNNAGLVLGDEIANWRAIPWPLLATETFIDGASVGRGSAAIVPGGPFAALAFIFEHAAKRGRPLRAGQYISTGATTGVHLIESGQTARCDFGAYGDISCRAAEAAPRKANNKAAASG